MSRTTILTKTVEMLRADPALHQRIQGRVYTTWATEGQMPRVILNLSLANVTNQLVSSGTLTVDLFQTANDIDSLQDMAEMIESVFHYELVFSDDTRTTLRYYLATEQLVPESDSQLSHYNMTFDLRYFRARRPVNTGA